MITSELNNTDRDSMIAQSIIDKMWDIIPTNMINLNTEQVQQVENVLFSWAQFIEQSHCINRFRRSKYAE